MNRLLPTVCLALGLAGCIDTTVESTTIALSVAGTEIDGAFEGRGGVPITLERADIVFGPLTLCAGFTAGELCDEALAEWRDATVVNALDPEARVVGHMDALTGTTRSYMYDHGLVSLLTRPDTPLVTEAAASLDGASVALAGVAELGEQRVPFRVAVPIAQSGEVEQGVPVVRSSEMSGFEHTILSDDRSRLTVRFDPRGWLATANFAGLVSDSGCTPGLSLACAGTVEERCDAAGVATETRNCADEGLVCVRDLGCVESVELDASTQVGRAVRNDIEAGARPGFEFGG